MNNKYFNQFKSYANKQGSGSNPKVHLPLIVGGILFYLATQSIYYGNEFHLYVFS